MSKTLQVSRKGCYEHVVRRNGNDLLKNDVETSRRRDEHLKDGWMNG